MNTVNPYQAPASEVSQSAGGAAKQGLVELYFSFKGRVPRKVIWLYFFLPVFGLGIVAMMIDSILFEAPVLYTIVILASIWPSLALQVKRWHDRDKSGWWILINLVPFIGGLWAFIENFCLRGTEGENRFGPEPSGY